MDGAFPGEGLQVVATLAYPEMRHCPTSLVVRRLMPYDGGGSAQKTWVGPVLHVDRPDMAVGKGDPQVVGVEAGPHLDGETEGTQLPFQFHLGVSGTGDELPQWATELT